MWDWRISPRTLDDSLLSRLRSRNGSGAACFGDPAHHFGITAHPVPRSAGDARAQGCLLVASLSVLYEWPPLDGSYDWVKRLQPSDVVGDSFRVYDLKGHP